MAGKLSKIKKEEALIRKMYDQVYSSGARKIGMMVRNLALKEENIGQNCILYKKDMERALISAGVTPKSNILDLCCGDGMVAFFLAKRFNCRITGVDISRVGIEVAKSGNRLRGAGKKCSFRLGYAQNLPFSDNSFDIIYSFDSFIHIYDKERVIKECYRVLKPGGRLVFFDWIDARGVPKSIQSCGSLWGYIYVSSRNYYEKCLKKTGFDIIGIDDNGRNFIKIIRDWANTNLSLRNFFIRKCGREYFNRVKQRWVLAKNLSGSKRLGQLLFIARKPFESNLPGSLKKRCFKKVLEFMSGYCGLWVLFLGIKSGILEVFANSSGNIQEEELIKVMGTEKRYIISWLRAAYSFGILDFNAEKGWCVSKGFKTVIFDHSDSKYIADRVKMYTQLGEIYKLFPDCMHSKIKIPLHKQPFSIIRSMAEVSRSDFQKIQKYVVNQNAGLKSCLEKGGDILDIGSGLGYGAMHFSYLYPKAKVTAVEIDARAARESRRNIHDSGLDNNIQVKNADILKTKLAKKFDFIYMNLALHEVCERYKDKVSFIRKCHKLLKENGFLLVSELPFSSDIKDHRSIFTQMLTGVQVFEAVLGDSLTTIAEFKSLLRSGGFKNCKVVKQPDPTRVFFLCRKKYL